ncbi:MAG: AraC family transcriptional regulator [Bacteroidota bacterium]
MLLKQFPDINWVRQLKSDAARGTGNAWNNVVLNFECREASRLNLDSPFSLFLNNKGHSYCKVNKDNYRVATDTFLLAQPGDMYGLTIDNISKTELSNIHINRQFFYDVAHSLTGTHEQLLDNPVNHIEFPFPLFSQMYQRNPQFDKIAARLTADTPFDQAAFELALADLIGYLLSLNEGLKQKISELPFAKAAVRQDIYKRLALAKDYIHSNHTEPLSLETICRETGMSKFHFLRVFKLFYGITPYQYLTKVRMEKAVGLLKTTKVSIGDISAGLGFEYPNSFIKAFTKTYGAAPLQYRRALSNFG